jgi:hypothetical protein
MIMRKFVSGIAAIGLSIILLACSVSVPQRGYLKSGKEVPEDLTPYEWHFEQGDFADVLLAVSLGVSTVFGNDLGGAVLFDGWNIRRIQKLGTFDGIYTIEDEGSNRLVFVDDKEIASLACAPWREMREENATVYTQNCNGAFYGRIRVDMAGDITEIYQRIVPSMPPVSMTKR